VEAAKVKIDIFRLERQRHQIFHDLLHEDIPAQQKDFTLPEIEYSPNIFYVDAVKFIPNFL
jgi:hypothetical protein